MMKIQTNACYIAGLSVRTTNENGQAATDIPALWHRFFGEDTPSRIPGRLSEDLYCVYTDYEKDHTKPYTTVLGYRVSSLEALPEGLTGIEVPAATCQIYTVKGKLADGMVFRTWQQIWSEGLSRAYTADFEVYGPKARNPEDAEVDIFIALR